MSKEVDFTYNIEPVWDAVKEIRDKVEALLATVRKELSYASKMVTSELIENAIKYGSAVDSVKTKGIGFEFSVSDNQIRIKVTNRIISEKDYENVKTHIGIITETNNPKEIYVQRLAQLMENPKIGESQLGLYRIAYEGEFDLQYEFNDGVLTIIATRSI